MVVSESERTMIDEMDKTRIKLRCVIDVSNLTKVGKIQAMKWVLREIEAGD